MSYYEAFMWLLFAHFLGDWGIWNPWMAGTKGKHWEVMTAHCMIYTGCCVAALAYIGVESHVNWAVCIFITHYAVDKWKCRYATVKNFPTWHIHVDQCLHFGILIGILVFQRNENLFVW